MGELMEITFMQTRLLRLASKEWHLPVDQIAEIFRSAGVFYYIESGYGLFHCEGDEAVLEDIEKFLTHKGVEIYVRAV